MISETTPSTIYAFFFHKDEHPDTPEKRLGLVAGIRGNWNLIYYHAYKRDVSESGERFRLLDRILKFVKETFIEIPYRLFNHIGVIHDDVGNIVVNLSISRLSPNGTVYPELFIIFAGGRVIAARACFTANMFSGYHFGYDGHRQDPNTIIKMLEGERPDDFGFRLRDNRLTDEDKKEWFKVVSDNLMKESAAYIERGGKGSTEVLHGWGVDSYNATHDYYVFVSPKLVWI